MRFVMLSGILILAGTLSAGAMPGYAHEAPEGPGIASFAPRPVADYPEPRPYGEPPPPRSDPWFGPRDGWEPGREPEEAPPRYGYGSSPREGYGSSPRFDDGQGYAPAPEWDEEQPQRCWFRPGPWGPERVCRR